MAFVQVRKVIEESCRNHVRVSHFFDDLMDVVDDVKLRFILSNMRDHSDEIVRCIQIYLKESDSPGLNSWLQYLPDMESVSDLLCYDEEMDESDILCRINTINRVLKENYDKLCHVNMAGTAIDIFVDIRDLSNHDAEREGWQKIMMSDL